MGGNDVPNHGSQTWVAAPLSIMMVSSAAAGCPIWVDGQECCYVDVLHCTDGLCHAMPVGVVDAGGGDCDDAAGG